jgi:hypothetical protein
MKNKIKRAWRWLAGEAAMIWAWVKNLFFVYGTTKSRLRIFTGYGHYWFAKKYADRRTEIQGGKWHYVIPVGDYSLAVVNKLEMRYLKNKGILSKGLDYVKLLENAYYTSRNKTKTTKK